MITESTAPPGTLRQQLERRFGALKLERSGWESHYRDLEEHILPRRARFLATDRNRGNKINASIIDSTATTALRTLAAGLMSGTSSPSRPWFRFVPQDRRLQDQPAVKAWSYIAEQRVREVLAASNVYNAIHQAYEDLGAFGTAALILVPDERDIVRAYTLPVGSYWLATGKRQTVDTLYREMEMTAGQMVDQFGTSAVSISCRQAYERGDVDRTFTVRHAIEPNRKARQGVRSRTNKAFRSIYWEVGAEDGKILREGGFDRLPVLAPRWHVTGLDTYGRSPGMDALPDVRQLQHQTKRKAEAVDKLVRPPLQAPASMRNYPVNLLPGGINFVPDGMDAALRSVYEVRPAVNDLRMDIQETQRQIRQAFYADLFLMISELDRREITAAEIYERRAEKMLALGPVLERLQDELLNPLIDLVYAYADEAEIIPAPPEELDGVTMDVELQSTLARDQRADAVIALERLSGFIGGLAAMYPEVRHKLDPNEAVEEMAELTGVPPTVLRPTKEAQQAGERERMAAEAQQALEAVKVGAESAKITSEITPDTPLLAAASSAGGLPV